MVHQKIADSKYGQYQLRSSVLKQLKKIHKWNAKSVVTISKLVQITMHDFIQVQIALLAYIPLHITLSVRHFRIWLGKVYDYTNDENNIANISLDIYKIQICKILVYSSLYIFLCLIP